MTLSEIRATLLTADETIQHYWTKDPGHDYSFWEETQDASLISDGSRDEEGWRFTVHRFTADEYDPVARRILQVLDADDRIAVRHLVTPDEGTDYIHHIFDCTAL